MGAKDAIFEKFEVATRENGMMWSRSRIRKLRGRFVVWNEHITRYQQWADKLRRYRNGTSMDSGEPSEVPLAG